MSKLRTEWNMPRSGGFIDTSKSQIADSNNTVPAGDSSKPRNKPVHNAASRAIKKTPAKRTKGHAGAMASADVSPAALAAVALFKGIEPANLATAVGIPTSTLIAYFQGKQVSLRAETKRNLADYLGVDSKNGRLRSGQVHIFQLGYISYLSSKSVFEKQMAALGALIKDSSAAAINFSNSTLYRRMTAPQMHVLQNQHIRAIFVSAQRATYKAKFAPEYIPGCTWVRRSEELSMAGVYQREMELMLRDLDVTPVDFDEIFLGKKALSWSDVQTTAREHQVSKLELVQWIKTVGANRKGKIIDKNLRVISVKKDVTALPPMGTSDTNVEVDLETGLANIPMYAGASR